MIWSGPSIHAVQLPQNQSTISTKTPVLMWPRKRLDRLSRIRLLIAGVTVLGEINPATDTVMNFFWLGGSFTFAVLLGVVTDDITVFVDNVRKVSQCHQSVSERCKLHQNLPLTSVLSSSLKTESPGTEHLRVRSAFWLCAGQLPRGGGQPHPHPELECLHAAPPATDLCQPPGASRHSRR